MITKFAGLASNMAVMSEWRRAKDSELRNGHSRCLLIIMLIITSCLSSISTFLLPGLAGVPQGCGGPPGPEPDEPLECIHGDGTQPVPRPAPPPQQQSTSGDSAGGDGGGSGRSLPGPPDDHTPGPVVDREHANPYPPLTHTRHASCDITFCSHSPTGTQLPADSGETHDPRVQSEVGWPGPNQEEAAAAAQELQLDAGEKQNPSLPADHLKTVQLNKPFAVCVCVCAHVCACMCVRAHT